MLFRGSELIRIMMNNLQSVQKTAVGSPSGISGSSNTLDLMPDLVRDPLDFSYAMEFGGPVDAADD